MNRFDPPPSRFDATELGLQATCRKHASFPKPAATVVRMVKLLHKLTVDHGNELLRAHGLSYPEYNVLMMIDASPDGALNPSLIADAAGEKSANVTRLTNQLVDKGLIARQPSAHDRRMSLLRLTAQGEALIAAFLPDVSDQLLAYTRHLDAGEQAQLQQLMAKLLRGVEDAL
ncbi:MarR family transcriptional regulator, negative regulator of the multidrug operon emrRAB [Pseudoxanthomonas sp. GM95]|uniref:MarR family winged helix-turn-helix transcriptional regulator n=1 Tax=Pseudoxanthomonas sp. GM95 TaxID=1881043 RepID=UPI0008C8A3B2|nr:MarR family transcriptional regulator [Pseudoxanthomonas sp. GM95]SEL64759.1 MarR family transcriptional regulator, negative regulator of the multidrug operon emrRAB [Pseudoxanthomonas sp. GM95]